MLEDKAVHIYKGNAMMHFRKILQHRQIQHTLDKFLVKKTRKATAFLFLACAGRSDTMFVLIENWFSSILWTLKFKMEGRSHRRTLRCSLCFVHNSLL